jgi:murein DD-endopeptidase MepM/ murein hydrolase activator NlpD
MLASSLVPQTLHAYSPADEEPSFIESPLIVETKHGVSYPTEAVRITQNYGFFHPGIDFDGITGDPINPITAGKVELIEYSNVGYGNAVYINHGNGTKSLYAHLSKINVSEGDTVTTETIIGEMGATGRSFGDHLHLEVYEDGRRVNPLTILQ